MGKESPAPAPPRDLAKEISQILSQGPSLLASEQALSPQQTGLDLSNLNLALYGTPAGQRQVMEQVPVDGWINTRTGVTTTTLPPNARQRGGRPEGGNEWTKTTIYQAAPKMVDQPAQEGLLSMYGKLLPQTQAWNTQSRQAAMSDLRALNPGQASLYDLLNQSATQGLKAGSTLAPEDTWKITNSVRSNWANRGVGNAPSAQLDEALQLFGGGQQLLQQRQNTAGQVAQLGSQLYTTPAMTFAQQTSPETLLGYGSQYGQQANILQQLGGYGSDLFNTNFNAQNANNINAANAHNAGVSNTAQIAGSIAAAALLACWAARAVFGVEDSRWTRFRLWMLRDAPLKLRRWYLAHGATWAKRLEQNPSARATVQAWMERRIACLTTPA